MREGQHTLHEQFWSLRILTKRQGSKKSASEEEYGGVWNPGQSRLSDLNGDILYMSEKIFRLARWSQWNCIHAKGSNERTISHRGKENDFANLGSSYRRAVLLGTWCGLMQLTQLLANCKAQNVITCSCCYLPCGDVLCCGTHHRFYFTCCLVSESLGGELNEYPCLINSLFQVFHWSGKDLIICYSRVELRQQMELSLLITQSRDMNLTMKMKASGQRLRVSPW